MSFLLEPLIDTDPCAQEHREGCKCGLKSTTFCVERAAVMSGSKGESKGDDPQCFQ